MSRIQRKLCRRCRHHIKGWASLQYKGKLIPIKAWKGPQESRRLRLREGVDNRHIKLARLSAVSIDNLYPPVDIPNTNFCYNFVDRKHIVRLEWLSQWKIHVGNRTRESPACSAQPQTTTPLCTGIAIQLHLKKYYGKIVVLAPLSFHLSKRSLEVYRLRAFVVMARHIEQFLNCKKQLQISLVTTDR
jgi:hypothetical protein